MLAERRENSRAAFALTKPLKMNMVKRIMGRPRQEECSPQDNALGLMHLRRLFSELCHPPRHMTQKEQEEKLYMMLPVFNRVFGNAPPSSMTEKFSDLLQFTTQVSRLMVTEIRRRASNKSTEAASRAIVQFLEVNQSEEASRGWMLLTTINLLASSGQYLTLVKCLYLFFDLPHMAKLVGPPATAAPTRRPQEDPRPGPPSPGCPWPVAEAAESLRPDPGEALPSCLSPEGASPKRLTSSCCSVPSPPGAPQPAVEECPVSAHHHLRLRPQCQRGQIHTW
ncbi:WD repeat and FYVE domain-containing protein 3 isoform X1 [Lates japonicus]|uniref:WD repeat and FYVE domain-containing protein 3 isoform X1 n=1 Tax=Lates japonicus TaxID=270547 RepID=A0AAD3RA50_LATJO|nr:WD repeat and FYVE domain-containing protein 3 isoform X1 [Lates japonicus]